MKARAISLLAVLVLFIAPLARGDVIELTLVASTVPTVITVTDNGVWDNNLAVGKINWAGIVGSWEVDVALGIMDPHGYPLGSIDLTSTDGTPAYGESLEIYFTRYNMAMPSALFQMDIGGTIIGTGSALTYTAYRDNSNALYGTAATIGTLGPYAGSASPGTSFSGGTSGWAPGPFDPLVSYSITQRVILTSTSTEAMSASFDADLQPVPEPATGILFGLGALALGTFLRRRFA